MQLSKTVKPIGAVRETATGSRSPAGPRRLGTATRMSTSLFRRLSAFFGSTPDQDPKAAKFAVLTPGHAGFPNRAKRSEGSDSAPTRNAPVSPYKPLCAILSAKERVYPLSPVKTNVSRLWECDLKPLWRGLFLVVWDLPSAYFRQIRRLSEGFIYSRIKAWRRKRRRSRHFCPQCGQLTGFSAQAVVASFAGCSGATGVLVPVNAGGSRV